MILWSTAKPLSSDHSSLDRLQSRGVPGNTEKTSFQVCWMSIRWVPIPIYIYLYVCIYICMYIYIYLNIYYMIHIILHHITILYDTYHMYVYMYAYIYYILV